MNGTCFILHVCNVQLALTQYTCTCTCIMLAINVHNIIITCVKERERGTVAPGIAVFLSVYAHLPQEHLQ